MSSIQRDHVKCAKCLRILALACNLDSACDVMEPENAGASSEPLRLGNGSVHGRYD